jgi:hypothetical protein
VPLAAFAASAESTKSMGTLADKPPVAPLDVFVELKG